MSGAEEAYEELQWENRRRAAYEADVDSAYYEEMARQYREYLEAVEADDRKEEERNR